MGIRELGSLLFISVLTPLGCVHGQFNPVDNYLVDCGSSVDTTIDNRNFVADGPASWSITTQNHMLASTNSSIVSKFENSALYRTARIFTGLSSYSFPIRNPGRHWIRLYFFPFLFQGLDLTEAKFSVTTQEFVLLSNFQAPNGSTNIFKEYAVNIISSSLVLSFLPSGNSTAFVNAIELVSVPDGLFSSVQKVDPSTPDQNIPQLALETVHRINMGGPKVVPMNDTLTRTWIPDQRFLYAENLAQRVGPYADRIKYQEGGPTRETAPESVYRTATAMADPVISGTVNFNVTWEFPVDASFLYFVRFHFCDIQSESLNQLYFNVYINSQAAARDLDLSSRTFNLAAPYIMDFVARVGDGSGRFRISIGPSTPRDAVRNATLNGLEIMKISNSFGSLDGQLSVSDITHPRSKNKIGPVLRYVLGTLGAVILAVGVFMLLRRWRLARKRHSRAGGSYAPKGGTSRDSGSGLATGSSSHRTNLCFRFPLTVVQEATHNFHEDLIIGLGGFGKVYKGVLRDGTQVAVKRGNPRSRQGVNEFYTEIELLSRLHHRHLVSLMGYCDEQNEMILVYEYVKNGTLRSHLYGSDLPSLSWKQRLEICTGAAKGLHYLHTGQARAIIHRDVKSPNILLDEHLTAKVADFGLSKTLAELGQTHVSTAVKGSFGYLDPEYYRSQQLTEKSDVYSFGVVLLEVLCARPVIDRTLPDGMISLAEWAMECQKRGQLKQVVDPRIAGTIRSDSLRKFGETVEKCLADYGVDRPSMGDVLWNLQYVLQLQEAVTPTYLDVDSVNRITELASRFQKVTSLENSTAEEFSSARAADLSGAPTSRVFSSGTDLTGVSSTSTVFSSGTEASGALLSRVFSELVDLKGR